MPRFAASLACLALFATMVAAGCADLNEDLGEDLGTTSDEVRGGRVQIHHDPHQLIHYGFDIKQPNRAQWLTGDRAREIFGTDGFDLLRIPVYAHDSHPAANQVRAGDYDPIVAAVERVRRVNANVEIFASLRLEYPASSFPAWVMKAGRVNTDRYAQLLMDFLQHMQSRGVPVHYLGPDNESIFNGGDMTPARFAAVVRSLRERCQRNGVPMPQIVGNDQYSPNGGADWTNALRAQGNMGLLDVAGVHYYSKHRTGPYRASLADWAQAARGRPLWDTEYHWNNEENRGEFADAVSGILTAFDNTDLGVDNITWWAYNPRSEATLTAQLHSALVRATVRGRPLTTNDDDGAPLGEDRFNTRAFRQGNDVTLVVVNDTNQGRPNRQVETLNRRFDRGVTFERWQRGAGSSTTGAAEGYPSPGVFRMDFPAHSITVVRIPNVRTN